MNRPNTCVNLIKAINRVAGPGRDALRLSRALANVIVAQMLPDGVVKGGSALMFRYGGNATRYTRDVDTARVMSLDAYLDKLEASLKTGWNGFTGRLQHVEPAPGIFVERIPPVAFCHRRRPRLAAAIIEQPDANSLGCGKVNVGMPANELQVHEIVRSVGSFRRDGVEFLRNLIW